MMFKFLVDSDFIDYKMCSFFLPQISLLINLDSKVHLCNNTELYKYYIESIT